LLTLAHGTARHGSCLEEEARDPQPAGKEALTYFTQIQRAQDGEDHDVTAVQLMKLYFDLSTHLVDVDDIDKATRGALPHTRPCRDGDRTGRADLLAGRRGDHLQGL
jgi:hypothetical protein